MKIRPQPGGHHWGLPTHNKLKLKQSSDESQKMRLIFFDFDPSAFPKLYNIAHSEPAVDKWTNSASDFAARLPRRVTYGRRRGKNFLMFVQHWSGAVTCPAR
jgi:hypothetical protein